MTEIDRLGGADRWLSLGNARRSITSTVAARLAATGALNGFVCQIPPAAPIQPMDTAPAHSDDAFLPSPPAARREDSALLQFKAEFLEDPAQRAALVVQVLEAFFTDRGVPPAIRAYSIQALADNEAAQALVVEAYLRAIAESSGS